MTLATAWTAASPFGPSLAPESAEHPDELRKNVAAAVAAIVNTKNETGSTDGRDLPAHSAAGGSHRRKIRPAT